MFSRLPVICRFPLILLPLLSGQVVFSRRVYKEKGRSYQQIWNWNPADNSLQQLTDSARDHFVPTCSGQASNLFIFNKNCRRRAPGRGGIDAFAGQLTQQVRQLPDLLHLLEVVDHNVRAPSMRFAGTATPERSLARRVQSRRRRVVTASWDNTARVWAVLLPCCGSQGEAERLASLAEAVSQYEVSDTGALTLIDGRERLRALARQSGTGPAPELSLDWIIRRFAAGKKQ